MTGEEEQLRARLSLLMQQTTRSEVARRTGTSLMNVSRYMRGTRVPAAFCMALCREFGLNPAWLLAGQGPMLVADVAQDQTQTAGDLLKLVEALGAVSRMRLGSVAGDRGLRMMRELSDALGTYERLRAKLNQRTSELQGRVLTELEGALQKMDLPRSAALLSSATQLARLTDDEALAARLLTSQAHLSFLTRRLDEALGYMRKRFGLAMAHGGVNTAEGMEMGLRLALTLQDMGHNDEARRTMEAIMALADTEARKLPVYSVIACAHAIQMAGSGRLAEGLAALTRHVPGCDARRIGNAQAGLVRAQVLAGVLPLEDALHLTALPGPKWLHLSMLACAAENAPVLGKCARFLESPEGRVPRQASFVPHYAGLMARVLARPVADLDAQLARIGQSVTEHGVASPMAAVLEAAIRRVAGDADGARAAHRQARQAMQSVNPGYELAALHHRNALLLDAKGAERLTAEEFFRKAAEDGYSFIARLKP